MKAVGHDGIHAAHEGHEFYRRIAVVEDDGPRLHAIGNIAAGGDVFRMLHGNEDDVHVFPLLQRIGRLGNGVFIG